MSPMRRLRWLPRGSQPFLFGVLSLFMVGGSLPDQAITAEPAPKLLVPLGESIPEELADPSLWQDWINEEARKRGVRLQGDWARVATIFRDEAAAWRVNWPGALVQSIHETNFFTFDGDVPMSSKNVGGIGVSKVEVASAKQEGRPPGDTYNSLSLGVRAFLQYIATYAGEAIPEGEIASAYLKRRDAQGVSNQQLIHAKATSFVSKFNREITYFDLGSMPNAKQPDQYPGFARGALGYAGDPNYGPKLAGHWERATAEVRSRYERRMYESLAAARPPATPTPPAARRSSAEPSPSVPTEVDYGALSAARSRPEPSARSPEITTRRPPRTDQAMRPGTPVSRTPPTEPEPKPEPKPEPGATSTVGERRLDGRYLVFMKPGDSAAAHPSPWLLTCTTSDGGTTTLDLSPNPRAAPELVAIWKQAGLLHVSGLEARPLGDGNLALQSDQLQEVLQTAIKKLEASGSNIANSFSAGLNLGGTAASRGRVRLEIKSPRGTVRQSTLGNLTIQLEFQITPIVGNDQGQEIRAPAQPVRTQLLASPLRE